MASWCRSQKRPSDALQADLNGHSGPVVLLGGYIVLEPRSATHYLLSDQKTRKRQLIIDSVDYPWRRGAAVKKGHLMRFKQPGGMARGAAFFIHQTGKPLCRAILCGGEFHASNAIFLPLSLQDTLSHLSPDIAYYSAAGIDCELVIRANVAGDDVKTR
jgi:DeoR family deoxyribose operon repressor